MAKIIKPSLQVEKIRQTWQEIYENNESEALEKLLRILRDFTQKHEIYQDLPDWHRDVVLYSLYVDLFSENFPKLTSRLDYFETLGINCLWLLPILDSPMRDGGFDIRQYDGVRRDLLGLSEDATEEEVRQVFQTFLDEAHKRNIRVIFDVALNHTSDEHRWFQEAKSNPESPYRDYYIWSKTTEKYKDARLLFKGMEDSNWEKLGDEYYFHRFYAFQPDLNYRNPEVTIQMCRNFLHWLRQGVDGFRLDAIPFLWKEEGTNCENLPKTHSLIKLIRAVVESVRPSTLLLAEACQPPHEVVRYFGDEDECHAAYHFPLMPQIFKALAKQVKHPIINILKPENTPKIPDSCQWFIFLRNHDELTLEMVSDEDRKLLNEYYLKDPRWGFRIDEGISARLANLMDEDPQFIGLAFSIMFTMGGTPIIYYGDEFGKLNDEGFYEEMSQQTGYEDTRFFGRGKIKWDETEHELKFADSYTSRVFRGVQKQIYVRNQYRAFGRGKIEWIDVKDDNNQVRDEILAYYLTYENEKLCILQNLSRKDVIVKLPFWYASSWDGTDLMYLKLHWHTSDNCIIMPPRSFYWFDMNK